jgi:Integrase zinc binding domain
MDSERLNSDIISALQSDPISAKQLDEPSPGWSVNSNGFLRHKTRIYVLDVNDLRLRVLQQCHDHPLSGHLGQNKTLNLIRRTYSWPLLRTMVQDYCKSCTACMRAKRQRHKPYGLLKQLPIPEQPWNSISMDFIEKLPKSSGYDTILVIVDRLTKQSIVMTMSSRPPISDLRHPISDPGLRHRPPSSSSFDSILHHHRCSPSPLWSRTFRPPSVPVTRHSQNDTEHHGTINVAPNP